MSSLSPTDISATLHPSSSQGDELVLSGRRYALSGHAAEVLGDLVAALESGRTLEVSTVREHLSMSEVAHILGVSENHVVRLLEEGDLAYEQSPEVKPRILRSELDRYRANLAAERRAALEELTETYSALDAEMGGFVSTR